MEILAVAITVKPDMVEAFIAATLVNVQASRQEAGIGRFELLQDAADPTKFLLLEGYLDAQAPLRHKETAHYLAWKAAAEPMMAGPRTRSSWKPLEPESTGR